MANKLSKYYLIPAIAFDRMKHDFQEKVKTKSKNNNNGKSIDFNDPNNYTKNALLSRELRNRLMQKRMNKLMSKNNNNNFIVSKNFNEKSTDEMEMELNRLNSSNNPFLDGDEDSLKEMEMELKRINATNKLHAHSTNPFLTADEFNDSELSKEIGNTSFIEPAEISFDEMLNKNLKHSTPQTKAKLKSPSNSLSKKKNLSLVFDDLNVSQLMNKQKNKSNLYEDLNVSNQMYANEATKHNTGTLALLNDDMNMANAENSEANADKKFVFFDATMPSMHKTSPKKPKTPRKADILKKKIKDAKLFHSYSYHNFSPISQRTRKKTAKRGQENVKTGLTPASKKKKLSTTFVWQSIK